ncbi:MAG: hypothetical protein ABTQ34_01145 [Bdellovibrionales bacterium]
MISPMNAAPHLVLLIGDEGARLACHAPNNPANAQTLFAATHDSEAEKRILAVIAQHGKISRLTLLIDTLAQDYRVETVPRVAPLDRAKLIRRRLRQSFPGAAATASLKLDSTRFGFASWHADGTSRHWIDQLAPYAPNVALLPIEGARLATKLAPRDEWILILSLQRAGGLRQIVTRKGQPIFTRLTPTPPALDPETIATAAARDLKTTLGYLNRLGLDDSHSLHVVALLPNSTRPIFERSSLALRGLTLLTPHEAAQRMGLPEHINDDLYGDALFAADAARRKSPRLAVTPRAWKQARNDNALQNAGKRLSIAALLLATILTGGQAIAFAQALLDASQEIARRDDAQTKLNEEREKAAPVTEPLGRLRAAVERERIFAEPSPTPWAALDALLRTLPPDTRLSALEWQAPRNAPTKRDETLRLTIRLRTTAADREQWRASLNETTQIIAQALPEYALAVTRSPFPTRPEEVLTGGDSLALNSEPTADITLTRGSAAP